MSSNSITSFDLGDLQRNSTLTTNVQQDCIVTTYDKIKLVLIEYEGNKKFAQRWWEYLGMMISFVLPCFTADFKPFLCFSAEFLNSFFIIMSILFAFLAVFSVFRRIKNDKKITIDYCANRIKNDA